MTFYIGAPPEGLEGGTLVEAWGDTYLELEHREELDAGGFAEVLKEPEAEVGVVQGGTS